MSLISIFGTVFLPTRRSYRQVGARITNHWTVVQFFCWTFNKKYRTVFPQKTGYRAGTRSISTQLSQAGRKASALKARANPLIFGITGGYACGAARHPKKNRRGLLWDSIRHDSFRSRPAPRC
jgi:hypothetical protein